MKKNIIVTALFFILISSVAPSWGTLNDDVVFDKEERRKQHLLSVNRRSPDYVLNYLRQFPKDEKAQHYLYSYLTNKSFYEKIHLKEPRKNEAMVIYQKWLSLGSPWAKTKHEKDDETKYSFLIYTITKTKNKNALKKKINDLLKKEGCYPMAYMRLVEFMSVNKTNIIKSTFLFFEEKFQAKILESLDSDKNYYMKDSLRDKKAKFFLMMGDDLRKRDLSAMSFNYFLISAKLGHLDAMNNAGVLLNNGFDGQLLKAKALELFLEAAEQGHLDAMKNAGLLLRDGFEGQPPNKAKALELFLEAAEQGHVVSMNNAAVLLMQGFDGQLLKARALELFLEAAEQGHLDAMFNAGVLLMTGFDGQLPNKAKALELFLEAAEQGHLDAMFNAGVLLRDGFERQPPNKAEALELFLEAAKHEHAGAMYNAGMLLLKGFDEQLPDEAEALKLFLEAADLECANAMNNAGALLMKCFDEQEPDEVKALEFFKKAAELGYVKAMYNAGLLLIKNPSLNVKEAFEFFYNAIEKEPDNKSLIETIAICLLNTDDSELINEGLFFLHKASALGSARAKKYIEYSEKDSNKDGDQDQEFLDMLKATVQKPMVSVKGIATPQLDTVINNISSETDSREDDNEKTSDEENEGESEEEVDDAEYKIGDRYTFHNKEPITGNAKFIREQLRKARLNFIAVSEQTPLSKKYKKIVNKILNKDLKITINDIVKLFKEPYFKNQVIVKGTANGIMIVAHNIETNKHETTSMHRQHTKKRKKGLNPAFINDLGDVLKLF